MIALLVLVLSADAQLTSAPSVPPPLPGEPYRVETSVPSLQRLPADGASQRSYGVEPDSLAPAGTQENDGASAEAFPDGLSIADVIASLYQCYPEIRQARAEFQRTNGELLASWGTYDTKLKGYSLNEPTGFYENHRHGIGVARQTWWGGYLSAGYRIGRGDFQPWYKERETDKSGEFKVGWTQPLLRGRAIDVGRIALFQASLDRRASQPVLQQAILDSALEASEVYWKWVTAGTSLQAQRELLKLAKDRGENFEFLADAGKSPPIDVVLNNQFIAEREVKVLDAGRKFQAAAFKLSLYLRDEGCQPIIAADSWLPQRFPITERPMDGDLESDLAASLARRPEPQVLQLEIQKLQWQRQLACNDMLPNIDFVAEASQDLGPPASSSDDKDEFLLIVGLQGEVPIQRRKARGKIQSTSAKLSQLRQKLFLQQNKIEAELRTAYNALQLNSQIVEQAERSLRAAVEALATYTFGYKEGYSDLIYLNILETKVNETELKLIEAQGNWFTTLAQMQAALGLDPLEQSLLITELPLSNRPGPGRLPSQEENNEKLQSDWDLQRDAQEQ